MQTDNGFMDQIAKLMTNAAGAAKGVRDEISTMVRTQAEKMANDLDLAQREELEAIKALVLKLRDENEALRARMTALEGGGDHIGHHPPEHATRFHFDTARNRPLRSQSLSKPPRRKR